MIKTFVSKSQYTTALFRIKGNWLDGIMVFRLLEEHIWCIWSMIHNNQNVDTVKILNAS